MQHKERPWSTERVTAPHLSLVLVLLTGSIFGGVLLGHRCIAPDNPPALPLLLVPSQTGGEALPAQRPRGERAPETQRRRSTAARRQRRGGRREEEGRRGRSAQAPAQHRRHTLWAGERRRQLQGRKEGPLWIGSSTEERILVGIRIPQTPRPLPFRGVLDFKVRWVRRRRF